MTEERLDSVFGVLRQNMPRAPGETVDRMIKTVNRLEIERSRRAEVNRDAPERMAKRSRQMEKTPAREPKAPGM